jgi:hypothetical protein
LADLNTDIRIDLPIQRLDVEEMCTRYLEPSSQFLLWDCTVGMLSPKWEKWKQQGFWPYWLVSVPDGTVTQGRLPANPIAGMGDFSLMATRAGLMLTVFTARSTSNYDPAPSGVYQLENGAATKVLSGPPHVPAVSPNGCRVAIAYSRNSHEEIMGAPGALHMVVLDVCP